MSRDVIPRHGALDPEVGAAELAARYGLGVSGARPSPVEYTRRLWGRRHFIAAFARARGDGQYSRAHLGRLWQVMTPLLNAAVYYLIFGLLIGTRDGVPDFIPFLVTGVFVFAFTQSSVLSGVRAVSGNLGLVRALHFPRAVLPVALTLAQLRQMLVSMAVLVVIVLLAGQVPTWSWLLVVPVLLAQSVFNAGLALVAARLGSAVSDLAQLLPFVLRTWMYASGVMYSIGNLTADAPLPVRVLLDLNPAAVYIDLTRFALIDSFTAAQLPPYAWGVAVAWAFVLGVGGFGYFWQAEGRYGRD
ncbi:ABC transporter permease [Nocardiopsis ansamitocini]|uniref:Transport permease protein n=1 Tax=Nocardiopsis ansamitocini TaxID=1670832 RepID=A0A9W6P4R8_9ACTN|nr:ABC transporter permease [Nocardiopsis ansamitocini]GLU47061.1 transport permease protein [Nocardiopsis ansamitocini]